ncbi:MAG: hypothetical protein AAGA83_18305 [Cyanobacteria bacterium P01_F01_bin.116]
MRKQDLERDASSTSVLLSAIAFMLSALAIVAYFMFRFVSQPQTTRVAPIEENPCQSRVNDQEALLEELIEFKGQQGDEWSVTCQDKLDDVLYDLALNKAAEGQFGTSFTRLCQISERRGSEYFQEAQFLFNLWEQNRNTSGESQEIKPLLTNFFQNYDNPKENCPAARKILVKLNP